MARSSRPRTDLLRTARLTDAAEIGRLSTELGYPASPSEMAGRLGSLLDEPRHRVLVSEAPSGEGLSGWIHVEHRSSLGSGGRAEIVGLVVDSSSRRGGLGKLLLSAAEEWARSRGLVSMTVRSNAARESSHGFYAVVGFSRTKSQHVYVKKLR